MFKLTASYEKCLTSDLTSGPRTRGRKANAFGSSGSNNLKGESNHSGHF